jgi:hypothetical protein
VVVGVRYLFVREWDVAAKNLMWPLPTHEVSSYFSTTNYGLRATNYPPNTTLPPQMTNFTAQKTTMAVTSFTYLAQRVQHKSIIRNRLVRHRFLV